MGQKESVHVSTGLLGLLGLPWVYRALKYLLQRQANRKRLVQEYIRPFPGCRILDIGCGTADILSYLPPDFSSYTGLDFNPLYIESASRRWAGHANCRFMNRDVNDLAAAEVGTFDIVLALGLLHHLADDDAQRLLATVATLLKPSGRLITYDGVYTDRQNPLARWLISRDRGRAVRNEAGYRALAQGSFTGILGHVLHDTLRLPYTIFLMVCTKSG